MPRTVKGPPQLDAVFDEAEERLGRFFGDRQDDPSKGTIRISDERFILVRGAALSIEFLELFKRLFAHPDGASAGVAGRVLFDVAHALGKSDGEHFHRSMGLADPASKLAAGPVFFAHAGWGSVRILEESKPVPSEDYYLLYEHLNSFESDAWIGGGKLSDFPVCFMHAGYSSGWCEASFGLPLVAAEISCRARGDDACRFIMAPPNRIRDHVLAYLGTTPDWPMMVLDDDLWRSLKRDWAKEALLERALRDSERDFRRLFELSPDAIVVWRMDQTIRSANKAAATLLGYDDPADLVGRSWPEFVVAEDRPHSVENARKVENDGGSIEAEFRMQRKDGSRFFAQGRLVMLWDADGKPVETIAIARDISGHKTTEAALREQALRDQLTGLPNRPAFLERLQEAFAAGRRGAEGFAVLYIDVDLFKDVNDTLGHAAGDRLLRLVAARLRNGVRGSDFVARFGGDEFAILQTGLSDPADAGVLALALTRSMAAPFDIDGNTVHVTISTGISFYDPEIEGPEAMLTQADLALYRAKGEGRDRYCFHAVELDRQVRERVALTNELRTAFDRNELEVYYQPQVEMVSGRIVGVEALARWNHPQRGLTLPGGLHPGRRARRPHQGARALGTRRIVSADESLARRRDRAARRRRQRVGCAIQDRPRLRQGLRRYHGEARSFRRRRRTRAHRIRAARDDAGAPWRRGTPAAGRREDGDRRFRHGIFLAPLPAKLPFQPPQGRPAIRRRPAGKQRRRGDHTRDPEPRPRVRHRRHRRGRRDRRTGRLPVVPRMRTRAGIPLRQAVARWGRHGAAA